MLVDGLSDLFERRGEVIVRLPVEQQQARLRWIGIAGGDARLEIVGDRVDHEPVRPV